MAKHDLATRQAKLASSYQALLDDFSSAPHLQTVGNYTLSHQIGSGSFGQVYLARHQLTNGTKVVLKSTSRGDPNLAREIHHHRQFLHPHIARLYEVVVTETKVWLVLEFCPGDELYRYLVQHGKGGGLAIVQAQKIFAQLVGAVSYIHSKNCVHRDLKLENVLLDKKGDVKLVDFGFTREYEGKSNYLSTFCGTICYSAPEMLRGEKYAGEKVDVWSLGIILFALLTGQLPWDDDDDQITKQKILMENPTFPDGFNEQAKALIQKLLAKRSLHRPSLAEVLSDPFLTEFAPHQQATLKLHQPAPFTTDLEKITLERMKAAGIDIDKVIENVLSQRCDALAGWWALLIEKEQKKAIRRDRRKREKEAEAKILRRLSGASSRLERIAPMLEDVAEEGAIAILSPESVRSRPRSISRGRQNRRSTPQLLISDLPRLPEGAAVESSSSKTPPPVAEAVSERTSRSLSRPPLPPKERLDARRRRSSHLQLVSNTSDLVSNPPLGIQKKRFGRDPNARQNFRASIAAFKHWFVASTKRNPIPIPKSGTTGADVHDSSNTKPSPDEMTNSNQDGRGHFHTVSDSSNIANSYGTNLTPTVSRSSYTRPWPAMHVEVQRTRAHRGSISPSPITPRSSFRVSSHGLRGRKSTSSSVSSIRSLHRYTATHSKASSVSSDDDNSTLQSPRSTSAARSPHSSLKLQPPTPTPRSLSDALHTTRTAISPLEILRESPRPSISDGSPGVPKRKPSPLTSSAFSASKTYGGVSNGKLPSPAPFVSSFSRNRTTSANTFNAALLDSTNPRTVRPKAVPCQTLTSTQEEEEEEEEEEQSVALAMAQIDADTASESAIEDDEESVEEVDHFGPVHVKHGESVQSIMFYDDPIPDIPGPPVKNLDLDSAVDAAVTLPKTSPETNMSDHIERAFSNPPTITLSDAFDSPDPDSKTSTMTSSGTVRTPLRQHSDSQTNASNQSLTKHKAPEIPVRNASRNDLTNILRKSSSAKGLGSPTFYAAAIARKGSK